MWKGISGADLYEGDLYPVVSLNVQHLNPVARDGEPTVILGNSPSDVDLIGDAVLILGLCSAGQLDHGPARSKRNS